MGRYIVAVVHIHYGGTFAWIQFGTRSLKDLKCSILWDLFSVVFDQMLALYNTNKQKQKVSAVMFM